MADSLRSINGVLVTNPELNTLSDGQNKRVGTDTFSSFEMAWVALFVFIFMKYLIEDYVIDYTIVDGVSMESNRTDIRDGSRIYYLKLSPRLFPINHDQIVVFEPTPKFQLAMRDWEVEQVIKRIDASFHYPNKSPFALNWLLCNLFHSAGR